jgi:4-amino-4-deoxy-L-arabinose transferase-like glycosyltransferase
MHEKNRQPRNRARGSKPKLFMADPEPPGVSASASWRRDLFWLLLAFGFLFGFRLGTYPLANPDEGRYAEIPREMVVTGDWVTPRLDGVKYFEKPPLLYWAVAACYTVLGRSEWSMRAMPALFGLAGVLMTYAVARRMYGRDTGLAAAIVLGTSLMWFALSRLLVLDMAVSVLMSATLFCFILGVREPPGARRRWLLYGVYAGAALATLTKGLIGVLVTGAVMFFWLLICDQWKRLRPLHLPSGAAIFLAIAAPWHVLAAQRNPDWARFYFVHEHWERFTTTTHGREEPFWYFAPILLLGLFPWTGFLWAALRDTWHGGWRARKANADTWFFAIWAGFIFLFFSKSQSKLAPYILPVFPALAVPIGAALVRAIRTPGSLRVGLRVFAFGCGLLAVAAAVAALKPGVIRGVDAAAAFRPVALSMAAVLLAGGTIAPWLAKVRGPRTAIGAVVATAGAFFIVLTFGDAYHLPRDSTRGLAEIVRAQARPGDRVYHYGEFFHDFLYYSEREVGTVEYEGELMFGIRAEPHGDRFIDKPAFRALWAGPERVFALARKKDVTDLFADPSFRYHLLAETRHNYLFSNQP